MRYFLTGMFLTAATLSAQTNVISAKAGLIHYTEGDVRLDGAAVDTSRPGKFSQMKNGSEVRTSEGRAEVLLAAPSFVRLAENSGLKMLNNSLTEARFEVTAGQALVEAAEIEKNTAITVLAGGSAITIQKTGLYRIDMEPTPTLRVYGGEAAVSNNGESTVVKEGRLVALNNGGQFVVAKFDAKAGDELYRWSKRRSGYVSMANVAAANWAYTNSYAMTPGMWLWNPYFGMFTGVPMRGTWMSPFGYRYYNPRYAYGIITAPVYVGGGSGRTFDSAYGGFRGTGSMNPTYNSDFGYNTVGSRSSGGYSGGFSGSSGAGAAGGGAPAAGASGGGGTRGGGGGSSMGGGQSGGGGGGGSRGGN